MNKIKSTTNNVLKTMWIKIPYLVDKGDQILLKTKLKDLFTKEVKFRIIHSLQKLSLYTSLKDQIPKLMKSYLVYQFNCKGCNNSYIGKTEGNFCTRTEEYALYDEGSVIYNHIKNCSYYSYIEKFFHFNNDSFD